MNLNLVLVACRNVRNSPAGLLLNALLMIVGEQCQQAWKRLIVDDELKHTTKIWNWQQFYTPSQLFSFSPHISLDPITPSLWANYASSQPSMSGAKLKTYIYSMHDVQVVLLSTSFHSTSTHRPRCIVAIHDNSMVYFSASASGATLQH